MSSLDSDQPSISLQKAFISADFNSMLLFLFLAGAGLSLNVATILTFVPHHVRHRRMILGSLMALLFTVFGELVIQWYAANLVFSTLGATRMDMYTLGLSGANLPDLGILSILLTCLMQIVADGLLAWRCFHACGGSFLRIWPVIMLFISEIAMTAAVSVINAVITLDPSRLTTKTENQFNIMQGSYYCVTAATNSVATFMIGHKIYLSTRRNRQARKRYRHIIDIAMQSSAAYTFTMIATAVINIMAGSNIPVAEFNIIFIISNYLSTFTLFATISAPTIMVARLADAREKTNTQTSTDSGSTSNNEEAPREGTVGEYAMPLHQIEDEIIVERESV